MVTEELITTLHINPNKEGAFSIVSYACDLAKEIGFTEMKRHQIVIDIIESESYDMMLNVMKKNFSKIVNIQRTI